jgi:hypothetical protein
VRLRKRLDFMMHLNSHQSNNEFLNKDCQLYKPNAEMNIQIVDLEMMRLFN